MSLPCRKITKNWKKNYRKSSGYWKSKEEINSILSSSSIPKVDLDKIEQNAKAEYPNDYTLQKAYIKGAIKTYNDLKK